MPHIHELYDFTVGLIIVHAGKVLFVQHPKYDKWLMPGGHIELDEDPEQAIYREAAEETGLPVRLVTPSTPFTPESGVKPMPLPVFMDVHEANPPHKHIGLNYVLIAEHDQVRLSDEHLDYAWLSEVDLADPRFGLRASLQYYAAQGLAIAAQQ